VTQSKCPAWLAAGAFVILTIFIVEATAHFSRVLMAEKEKLSVRLGVKLPCLKTFLIEELHDESEQVYQQAVEVFNQEKLRKEENH
jgi:hypothetical protein